jgi:predicted RNA-binding protein associated with RNAse of E/G family
MSLQLAKELNDNQRRKGVYFMPFAKNHAMRINIKSEEVLVVANQIEAAEIFVQQESMGAAVTVYADHRPVAIFGFVSIWKGVAEAWLVADDLARSMPMTFTKTAKLVLDIAEISMALHRMQITIRSTDRRAYKWATAVGFTEECLMKKYGTDQVDYFLMMR